MWSAELQLGSRVSRTCFGGVRRRRTSLELFHQLSDLGPVCGPQVVEPFGSMNALAVELGAGGVAVGLGRRLAAAQIGDLVPECVDLLAGGVVQRQEQPRPAVVDRGAALEREGAGGQDLDDEGPGEGGLAAELLEVGGGDGLELRALVPVSIRGADEHGQMGNRLAAMRGPLPVYVEDPVDRLRVVRAAMDGLKESKQAVGAEVLAGVQNLAPPTILAQASRVNFSTRLFNLLVTNIPGPQVPLYLLGRRMLDVFPLVPLADPEPVEPQLLGEDRVGDDLPEPLVRRLLLPRHRIGPVDDERDGQEPHLVGSRSPRFSRSVVPS